MSIRIAAFEVLRSSGRAPMRAVESAARRHGLDARDRGFLRQIVGTELRRRGTLRALVKNLTRRPPKPELATMLHIGLAQILFLDRVPPHAAVSETVDAVRRMIGPPKATIANACLREALRRVEQGKSGDPRRDFVGRDLHWSEPLFRDPEEHPLLWAEDAFSIPAALLKRWVKRHGEERAYALARHYLDEPLLSVRVARGAVDDARAALVRRNWQTRASPS